MLFCAEFYAIFLANDILMVLRCCQWSRSLDGSQSSKICTWNIFSVQTRQAGSIFSPLRLPPLLGFWCLSVQNTAGSNIQGWVYGCGQYYEKSWGKLSLSLGDNNWHVRLQQMTTAQCLKYFWAEHIFCPWKKFRQFIWALSRPLIKSVVIFL